MHGVSVSLGAKHIFILLHSFMGLEVPITLDFETARLAYYSKFDSK